MLHLQAINIPVQLVDPGFTGLLPDASRGLLTRHIVRDNQFYGVGKVQHTLLFYQQGKVLVLNVFILFVLWNKKHYLQDLVNYTCVDLHTLPLVLRQGDHHPEHHPINHVVSKLNIKACTIKTFWRPICRVNHSFMTPQNYSQSYQVCILKINKTVKNQPLKPLCSALLKKYQDICPPK